MVAARFRWDGETELAVLEGEADLKPVLEQGSSRIGGRALFVATDVSCGADVEQLARTASTPFSGGRM